MPTSKTTDELRADFDRIAVLQEPVWNHNSHYHAFLLRHIPGALHRALDVGCGRGDFARLLAERADHVMGIDLSPRMIEAARAESAATPNVEYQMADVMTIDFAPDSFDCIASIATLHHLDLEAVLTRLKGWLKPHGTLIVLDLVKSEGWEYGMDVVAFPMNRLLEVRHPAPLPATPAAAAEKAAAWKHHGDAETYLTTREVRRIADRVLSGALVTRHWFWRYSLVWRK